MEDRGDAKISVSADERVRCPFRSPLLWFSSGVDEVAPTKLASASPVVSLPPSLSPSHPLR